MLRYLGVEWPDGFLDCQLTCTLIFGSSAQLAGVRAPVPEMSLALSIVLHDEDVGRRQEEIHSTDSGVKNSPLKCAKFAKTEQFRHNGSKFVRPERQPVNP